MPGEANFFEICRLIWRVEHRSDHQAFPTNAGGHPYSLQIRSHVSNVGGLSPHGGWRGPAWAGPRSARWVRLV